MKRADRLESAASQGSVGFEAYYSAVYGERWRGLRESLRGDKASFAWSMGLCKAYSLDSASVLAALSLDLGPELAEREVDPGIADFCAAPGGKALVILSRLPRGRLFLVNERSPERAGRLLRVLEEHCPADMRARVLRSTQDAAPWGRSRQSRYQRILLDAPCSSESHVLSHPSHLERWSKARLRSIETAQWALFKSAFLCLAAGGELVYSTCSLRAEENQGMVNRLLRECQASRILDPLESMGKALDELESFGQGTAEAAGLSDLRRLAKSSEACGPGRIFLPDSSGSGPIFISRIGRLP